MEVTKETPMNTTVTLETLARMDSTERHELLVSLIRGHESVLLFDFLQDDVKEIDHAMTVALFATTFPIKHPGIQNMDKTPTGCGGRLIVLSLGEGRGDTRFTGCLEFLPYDQVYHVTNLDPKVHRFDVVDGPKFRITREGYSESYVFGRQEEDQRKAVAYMEWLAVSYFGHGNLLPPYFSAYLEQPRRN
jgi:hypothetical protein